ncbi:MAG: T9SS type A sorting domain-containing protein [Bacteroidetes bacterium]|nr:T9SS type A sorting domain-containing protein [Bacteroidota bacterium]
MFKRWQCFLTATSVYAGSLIWTSTGTGNFSSPTSTNTFYGPSPAEYTAGLARLAFKATANSPYCPDVEDSLILQIHSAPNPTVWSSYNICQGDSFLLGFNSPGGTAPFTYQWTNSVPTVISTANTDYITPTATESYTYTVTDINGCTASFNTTLIYDASEIISGTAYLGAGFLTSGNVHLIKYYPQPQLFDTLMTTSLDGAGNYAFPPIPHGNYIVSVEPDTILFPNALITYLGNQTRSELANILGHLCSMPAIASLTVQQLLGGSGTGRISGEVVEWNGFGNRYNGPNNHIMVPGGPLKGIDVKLGRNPGGGIQARTTTNDDGKYNFDNLPDASYNVYVDIPGLPMDSFYVVNVISDSTTNLIYYADDNSVYPTLPTAVGIEDYKTELIGMGVHPNPATNYTTVLFETISVNSTTQLKVYDVTGKIAMSLNLTNLPKGKHEYHLNFVNQQLQSGIYFVELMNENGKQTKKLIVE